MRKNTMATTGWSGMVAMPTPCHVAGLLALARRLPIWGHVLT